MSGQILTVFLTPGATQLLSPNRSIPSPLYTKWTIHYLKSKFYSPPLNFPKLQNQKGSTVVEDLAKVRRLIFLVLEKMVILPFSLVISPYCQFQSQTKKGNKSTNVHCYNRENKYKLENLSFLKKKTFCIKFGQPQSELPQIMQTAEPCYKMQ